MTTNKFDKPEFVWVVEYYDASDLKEGSVIDGDDFESMTIYEYSDKPLTESDVLEEVRYSHTFFEDDKTKSLADIGIIIRSIKREKC